MEGFEQEIHIVTGQIGHDQAQGLVIIAGQEFGHTLMVAQILDQLLAPGRPALKAQGRKQVIGAIINPAAQMRAAGLGKGRFLLAAMF